MADYNFRIFHDKLLIMWWLLPYNFNLQLSSNITELKSNLTSSYFLSWYVSMLITYPTVISNILLPTELETAISPNPFFATITLVIKSGILVPAARIVRPIISLGMPIVSPVWLAHQTVKYAKIAIQIIQPKNVTIYHFLFSWKWPLL